MVAGVSKSGYYSWLKNKDKVNERLEREYSDYKLINKEFVSTKRKGGWRTIKMNLEANYGIIMNHKKIRRIMNKYELIAQVRRPNPYKKMAKATQEHRVCKNILNREFKQDKPNKVLLTDITYLYLGNGIKAYLSAVKDSADNEIVAYHVSTSLSMDIVMETLVNLKQNKDDLENTLIHSDYTEEKTIPKFYYGHCYCL